MTTISQHMCMCFSLTYLWRIKGK